MKASIAMTAIICGTFLFTVPLAYHVLRGEQLLEAATKLEKPVRLDTGLSKSFHTTCTVLGTLMIAVGVVGPFVKRQ